MRTDLIQWRPPISKWYNVKKEAYMIVYQLAKDRFEDILSESESITNKAIKMISALAAFLGFAIGYAIKNEKVVEYYYVFFILVVIDAILLFLLIAPKEIKSRGLSPVKSIPINLDDEADKDYQVELVYYQSIIIIQDNIDYMLEKNKNRALMYQWALFLFLILFAAVSTGVILSL